MKINDLKRRIKKIKILFFTYKKLTDHNYRSNYLDFIFHGNIKTNETIKREKALIENYWKCDPMHYYRYRLFEKYLSNEELIDYVPPYYFYNYHLPSIYGKIDMPITKSKIKLNDYFINKKISTPQAIAKIENGKIYKTQGENMLYDDLIGSFLSSKVDTFFVKPDKGMGGAGIFTIIKVNNELYLDGVLLDSDMFLGKIRQKDFIIQEGVSQRSDISSIYAKSVNTLRVITQYHNNAYRISAVVLRMGRNGSFVDNSAKGGISVNIDIERGELDKYGFTEHTGEKFEAHPDTDFKFEGFVLEEWITIKQNILDNAKRAFEFPEIAWDIAVLEKKISVIEINLNYGLDHLQCCIGGVRRKLNIIP